MCALQKWLLTSVRNLKYLCHVYRTSSQRLVTQNCSVFVPLPPLKQDLQLISLALQKMRVLLAYKHAHMGQKEENQTQFHNKNSKIIQCTLRWWCIENNIGSVSKLSKLSVQWAFEAKVVSTIPSFWPNSKAAHHVSSAVEALPKWIAKNDAERSKSIAHDVLCQARQLPV